MYTGWEHSIMHQEQQTWCNLKQPSQSQVSPKCIKVKGLGSSMCTVQLEEIYRFRLE